MQFSVCPEGDCTGCTACFEACPMQCIRMVVDKEGFQRPCIDTERCIQCQKCIHTCPINSVYPESAGQPKAYAAKSQSKSVRYQSSSGGLFSALSQAVLKCDGIVFAAGFDGSFGVVHKACTCEEELKDLRGSKYVQSTVAEVLPILRRELQSGRECLFCGTPCQVGGLRALFGRSYQNLTLVDFVCHGVPSPLAWSRYLEYRETQQNSRVSSISFRNKETGWKNYSLRIDFEDGSTYSSVHYRDKYLHSYLMGVSLRPSCYKCRFKHMLRLSDITLGDLWGIENMDIDWDDDSGVSLVLLHTEKGQEMLNRCNQSIERKKIRLDDAARFNPSMVSSAVRPAIRNEFMSHLAKEPFDVVYERYCSSRLLSRIRRRVARILA